MRPRTSASCCGPRSAGCLRALTSRSRRRSSRRNSVENNQLNLSRTQAEIYEWSTRNFGNPVEITYNIWSFLGMVEEVGEIAHAILKYSQEIRGTREEHEAAVI